MYRCNQAFEGSIKELYRVVAGKDPSKKSPANIEDYLETSSILRPKVLTQFKRYRQEWRNPSTHDYTLDFDQDEAFIAIVNIAAFAKTAIDQIASKIAFEEGTKSKKASVPDLSKTAGSPLCDVIGIYSGVFLAAEKTVDAINSETHVGHANSVLAGFLSTVPDLKVDVEAQLVKERPVYADLLITRKTEKCLVELRNLGQNRFGNTRGWESLNRYMEIGGIKEGVLILYSSDTRSYSLLSSERGGNEYRIVIPQSEEQIQRWLDMGFQRYDIK